MYVLKHISYPSHAKRVMTQFWTISKHKSSNVILYTQLNNLPIDQNEKRKKIGCSGCETVTIAKMAIFYFFMFRFRLRCPLQNINVLQQH